MADSSLDPTEYLVSLIEEAPIRVCGVTARRPSLKKRCTRCHEQKEREAFPLHPKGRSGREARCFECIKAYKAEHGRGAAQKMRKAVRHRERTYGLTPEQYEAMLTGQEGQCAICRKMLGPDRYTHIDHCHTTGKVRALLCMTCNRDVGIVERIDDARFAAIRSYVSRHKG